MSSPNDQIDDPAAPSGGVDWNTLNSRLVLFSVISNETNIQTVNGIRDAVRVDIAVLDGPDAGKRHDNTLVFPKVLVSQLKPKIGLKVVGRIGQGQAKAGQNAPWTLITATDDEKATAKRYLASPGARQSQQVADPWASNTPPVGNAGPPF